MSRRIARRNAKKAALEEQMERLNVDEPREHGVREFRKKKPAKNSNLIPIDEEHQFESNKVLQLYSECFESMFSDLELLNEQIQKVKKDLFNRDYITAFGDDINRQAYVVRWSPARSLAYASLFNHLESVRDLITDFSKPEDINVLSVGGGAGSELVAFGSCFCKSREVFTSSTKKLNLTLVDIADWADITEQISNYIDNNWIYKEHIDTPVFNPLFVKQDILADTTPEKTFSNLDLITMLFTTNELFKENKTASINFMKNLNKYCSSGCLLLITESAGSYSEIEVGTRKFPIQFLVDMILCGKPGEDNGAWELIDQNDSIWYRLEEGLQYDLKLENMRCFYRVYRKR